MNLENIKNSIKESIVQNFMENVKHARRGPEHQRPKSWSKGTKSGSDKKKMRREGKDAAREMNEAGDPWDSYDAWRLNNFTPQKAPQEEHPSDKRERERRQAISTATHDFADEIDLNQYHGHSQQEMGKLLKKNIENEYDHPREAAEHLAKVYPAPAGVDSKKYLQHLEQGIDVLSQNLSTEDTHKALAGNIFWQMGKSGNFLPITNTVKSDISESIYHKLKAKLSEQYPVIPSYEGDPELESDKIAGIETSLSPEERDPFHLLSQEDRESVHKTLKDNPGYNGERMLLRGGMRQLRTIADMARDTKTYGDDPKALHRIVQLADYMEKAVDERDDTQSFGNQDISLKEEESLSLRDRAAKLRALAYSLPSDPISTPAVNVRTQPAGQTPLKKEKDPKIPNPEIIQTTVALSNIEYDYPIRHKISSPALQRLKNLGFTKDQLGENDKGYRITDPVINLLVKK